jgi:hypothetical protein
MFCPICGQQQATETMRFCSRCGFPLAGVADVIANGGAIPQLPVSADSQRSTPRSRGVKQGVFLMLLCLLLTPLTAIFIDAMNGAEEIVALVAVFTFMGGMLRIFYALMFEASTPKFDKALNHAPQTFAQMPQQLHSNQNYANQALPPQNENFTPANSVYMPPRGVWREAKTGELIPPSITEGTTKLLEKEE